MAHPASLESDERHDPLACSALDAALFVMALAISAQYTLAVARLGQESMWGALPQAVFWVGLLGSPLAALVPAWLLGRFSPANMVWPAIGLATPLIMWSAALYAEPLPLLLVGGAAVFTLTATIVPARHGRRLRKAKLASKGCCARCEYDLTGVPGRVCPECGPRDGA